MTDGEKKDEGSKDDRFAKINRSLAQLKECSILITSKNLVES